MRYSRGRRIAAILIHPALAAGLVLAPALARAQPFERPGDTRPELPAPEEPRPRPSLELPPVPEQPPRERAPFPMQRRITVREFRVTGSTVFSEEDLAEITAPYTNRPITGEELQELRDALTIRYVNGGYLNSGAILPDPDPSDGLSSSGSWKAGSPGSSSMGIAGFGTATCEAASSGAPALH
jgi:hemolysin activation/secretion protein